MTKENIEKLSLVFFTGVSLIFASLLIGNIWASIDPIEMEYAIEESRWMFRLSYVTSLFSFIGVYILFFKSTRKFFFVGVLSFPVTFCLYLIVSQVFMRFLQPLFHQNFFSLFAFTMLIGTLISLFLISFSAKITSILLIKLIKPLT